MQDSRAFESAATVTYAHTSMGMGLAFTGMKREDQGVLRSWIADLSGEQPPELAAPLPALVATLVAAPSPAPSTPASSPREMESSESNASLRPIVYELITILMRNKLITEKEGALLLRRMFQ